MRTRRQAKDVDTAKAQKLIEVRKHSFGQLRIIIDWLCRFLIVSCGTGHRPHLGLAFDYT